MRFFSYIVLRNGPLSSQLLDEVRRRLATSKLAVPIESYEKHFAPFLTLDDRRLDEALSVLRSEFAVHEAAPFVVVARSQLNEMPAFEPTFIFNLYKEVERLSKNENVPIVILPHTKALSFALSTKHGPRREEWPAITPGRMRKGQRAFTIYEDVVRFPGRWEKVRTLTVAEVVRLG